MKFEKTNVTYSKKKSIFEIKSKYSVKNQLYSGLLTVICITTDINGAGRIWLKFSLDICV